MIRNERQFKVTQKQRDALASQLNNLLSAAEHIGETDDSSAKVMLRVQRASIEGQIADLDTELFEYERVRSGQLVAASVSSFADLPDALIKARISAGLTQRQLADRLQLKEQQIQRYESEGYASASLTRLAEVSRALGVSFDGSMRFPAVASPLTELRKRLIGLGFDRTTVDRRFLRDAGPQSSPSKVMVAAERISRVLGLPVDMLLSGNASLAGVPSSVRFKAPKNAAETKVLAYSRYAEGIARIVSRATTEVSRGSKPIPVPPAREFRRQLDVIVHDRRLGMGSEQDRPASSSELFVATLILLFQLGIPTIALRDAGGFHGASFTFEGKSVIVIKQTTDYTAHWLNDLLHEVGHIANPGHDDLRTWVELGDISLWSDDPEEVKANAFAADVLFEGRAGEVISRCKQYVRGAVERFKAVVPIVAREAEVAPDVLATYLAFQLTQEHVNWWGTSATFQEAATPWRVVTDCLLANLDLSALDETDRAALVDAISN